MEKNEENDDTVIICIFSQQPYFALVQSAQVIISNTSLIRKSLNKSHMISFPGSPKKKKIENKMNYTIIPRYPNLLHEITCNMQGLHWV